MHMRAHPHTYTQYIHTHTHTHSHNTFSLSHTHTHTCTDLLALGFFVILIPRVTHGAEFGHKKVVAAMIRWRILFNVGEFDKLKPTEFHPSAKMHQRIHQRREKDTDGWTYSIIRAKI